MTGWKPPTDSSPSEPPPISNWPTAFVAAVILICITAIVLEVIK